MGIRKLFGLDRDKIKNELRSEVKLEADIRVNQILDDLHEAFVVSNEQGIVLSWNSEAERIFGYSRTEAVGHLLEPLIITEAADGIFRKSILAFLETGHNPILNTKLEVCGLKADGSQIPIELTISPVKQDDCWIFYTFIHDITERRRAQSLQEQLSSIVNYSQDAVYSVDDKFTITSWNKASERLFGWTASDMVGKSLSILIPSNQEDLVNDLLMKTMTGITTDPINVKRVCKDFSIIDINLLVSPIKDHTGKIIGASAIARDITEDLKKERVREIYESMLLSSPYAVAAYDKEGNIMAFNPAAEKLYGIKGHDLEGKTIEDFITTRKLRREIKKIFTKVIKTGMPVENYFTQRKDATGKKFSAVGSYSPLRNRDDIIIGVYAVVFTEQEWNTAVERSSLDPVEVKAKLLEHQDKLLEYDDLEE